MTGDQNKLLAVFEVRIRDLMDVCDKQKHKIEELRHSLESKNKELEQTMQRVEAWKAKYDSVLTARIVSFDKKEVKNARMRLSELVREVDKCIALLNK
jgi:urease accessory protein UreH